MNLHTPKLEHPAYHTTLALDHISSQQLLALNHRFHCLLVFFHVYHPIFLVAIDIHRQRLFDPAVVQVHKIMLENLYFGFQFVHLFHLLNRIHLFAKNWIGKKFQIKNIEFVLQTFCNTHSLFSRLFTLPAFFANTAPNLW